MKRRDMLIGGIAVTAAAAGVGGALWRGRAASSADAPAADIWSHNFEQPGGGTLKLAELRGKPLLLNFWATWCAPCVTEMPMLDRFAHEQADRWQVVGLAVDTVASVLEFLAKHPVAFRIGLAGVGGVDLARALGNTGGALPFSVVLGSAGSVVQRKLGVINPDLLQSWVKSTG